MMMRRPVVLAVVALLVTPLAALADSNELRLPTSPALLTADGGQGEVSAKGTATGVQMASLSSPTAGLLSVSYQVAEEELRAQVPLSLRVGVGDPTKFKGAGVEVEVHW